MTELQNKLTTYSSVFFDTAPIIYFIEQHPQYGPIMKEFVDAFSEGKVMAYTSVITITEVLAKPVADAKDTLADQFIQFLKYGNNLQLLDITADIAEFAGKLRGNYKTIRTLDAIQLAAAYVTGSKLFVTNDKQLKNVKEMEVLILDDFS